MVHWGHEFERFLRRAQQLAAQELAEFGADIIVGHHPHVVQPLQLSPAKSGDWTVPIAYSLGSLLWGFAHEKFATSIRATPVRWQAEKMDDTVIQRVSRVSA